MQVRIFRQRVSQVHVGEIEVNDWLSEAGDGIRIHDIKQSSFMTDNTDIGAPGYLISVWSETT